MTKRLVGKAKCGCTVEATMIGSFKSGLHSEKEAFSIQQCPLHKAAPDLLKALERIDALLNNSEIYNHAWTNAPEKPEIAPRDIAKAAIAKAQKQPTDTPKP